MFWTILIKILLSLVYFALLLFVILGANIFRTFLTYTYIKNTVRKKNHNIIRFSNFIQLIKVFELNSTKKKVLFVSSNKPLVHRNSFYAFLIIYFIKINFLLKIITLTGILVMIGLKVKQN